MPIQPTTEQLSRSVLQALAAEAFNRDWMRNGIRPLELGRDIAFTLPEPSGMPLWQPPPPTDAMALRDEYMLWRRKRGLEPTAAQWTRFYDWEMALMARDDMPGIGIHGSDEE